MEANNFVTKIKANGTDYDLRDLDEIHNEFTTILTKLSAKDRGPFSLNVLCTLCRNLYKVPTWSAAIDAKDLLVLSIDCVRETRSLNRAELVKTLACTYHIHKYVVKQSSQVPPELILKLSYMPFEYDTKNLLTEYCKTYWNIIVDRLSYIERLRGKAIHKLLPKLNEDILKIIDIYDTHQFCYTILTFLVKKLHCIYNETYSEQLNGVYGEIFKQISSKNMKILNEKESLDLYVKFSDCFYVIAENASKVDFKDSALSVAVRTALALLGHNSDIYHCLQTFYLNTFCNIFENNNYTDTILKNITVSCDMTKKLGYKPAMYATYPYLNQLLRLFIEYSVTNSIETNFTEQIQENCMILMLQLMSELKYCQQLLKCDNCCVKNGLHDALRLSFLLKHFITNSITYNIDITNLSLLYNSVISQQYNIMSELKGLKCMNHDKFFRKLQTDTHNTAILLNKSKKYEYSIKLFNIYLENELKLSKHEIELKNISRALYNKGICELDSKLYEDALVDAFLSLVYAHELSTDKYMSLVMDIKAKALKADEEQANDGLQLMTVLAACKLAIDNNIYGDLKPFLSSLKFSALLNHEYSMYAKLWPSIVPIAGVWRSLNQLITGTHDAWITGDNEEILLWMLFEIISETPLVVRSIHNDHFKEVTVDVLARVEKIPEPLSSDLRVIQTILLFLNAEYDMADASVRHGWKVTEPTMDPDAFQAIKTLPQEHKAIEKAVRAVEIWTELALELITVARSSCLLRSLHLAEIFVHQLLHMGRFAYGLQLAYVCCQVAAHIGDKESYVRSASVLLYHADRHTDTLRDIVCSSTEYCTELIDNVNSFEIAIVYLCDMAIYYNKCGSVGAAARLVQLAQARLLEAYEKHPDLNSVDLAVGALLEAQTLVCGQAGPGGLSAASTAQRHYLAVPNTEMKWSGRRLRSAMLRYRTSRSGRSCAALCRVLGLPRRARAAAAAALPAAHAHAHAALYATLLNAHKTDDARVKIDNRLKYIIGLQPTPDQYTNVTEPKLEAFTPKQDFETMLDSNVFKNQLSPTLQCKIPKFQIPEYFRHTNCACYACENPTVLILTCLTSGLEASVYFRSQEFDIAENYFNGVKDMFQLFDTKLSNVINTYEKLEFEGFIVDYVKRMYQSDFGRVQLEILIEAAYFELRMMNFDSADDCIVTIHEILQDSVVVDQYLNNEIMNLLIASAKSREVVKKAEICDLISEFDNLKMSPVKNADVPKTPETKRLKIPSVATKVIVKDEELPKKRKVIKLILDDGSSDEKETEKSRKRAPKKSVFKIPVPITNKPVLETITPRISRKPNIVVTNASETPRRDKNSEFFTPQSTPEQFSTPMTTMKTYSKGLRRGIVKNLEQEFGTPKEKENIETPSRSRANRALQRATSPGKLVKEPPTRSSRRVK